MAKNYPQITLMYHCLYDRSTSESGFQNETAKIYKISAHNFESQVCSIAEWLEKKGLGKDKVVFTFDDGGVSFLTIAAPVLEKYGFRGIFFIATAYIGSTGFLTADQIRELAGRGHVIGSHSHTHPLMMNMQGKEELANEWELSQRLLREILGQSYNLENASIPNGFSSPAVLNAMRQAGIRKIYTSTPTTKISASANSTVIGRYAITDDRSNEDVLAIVSSAATRRKISLRNSVLGLAKVVLGPAYLKVRNRLLHKG